MVKSEPLARKLPYSRENVALLQGGEAQRILPPPAASAAAPAAPAVAPRQEPADKPDAAVDDEDKVEWGWPAQGKIVAGFSEASNKGLDIAGKLGDPVIASAPGRVVYSGSGLRGYGKLVIIKHNKTYLSAYAHNKDILVKEGQSVVKGQKIAEVGNTDSDTPKLHFEIRKLGKPVDPAKYLPPS
jgi:lipoprotein NlpD